MTQSTVPIKNTARVKKQGKVRGCRRGKKRGWMRSQSRIIKVECRRMKVPLSP